MISDAEMSELPVDPELAFVQFEKILRERVQEMETQEESHGFDADSYRLEYMNKVHAAAKVFGIEALANLAVPKADRNSNIAEQYRQFVTGVDYVTIQIRLHSVRSNRQGSVGLDDTTRAKIHHFIKQIREAIGQSDLPDDSVPVRPEAERKRGLLPPSRMPAASILGVATCNHPRSGSQSSVGRAHDDCN
jgi:hypothetical protein